MSARFATSVCALAIVIGVAHGASVMMNMPQISKMEVQCSKSGMIVDIEFDQPFDGIIFSKGHFSDPACRYVNAESKRSRYTLDVPMNACGTAKDSAGPASTSSVLSNVIVIQNDPIVQEIWDSAQKLSCRWTDRVSKTVSVRPLTIDMLEATEARFATADDDVVDVWMDLQQGRWPQTKAIDSAVRIGDQLSIVVGLKDQSSEMDLQVRDCYAHSTPDVTDPAAFRVQLTDAQGCVMKSKLMGAFVSDRPAGASPYAGNTIRWAPLSAFSFPDNMQVFTSCNVEVCKGGCEPNPCQPSDSFPSGSTLYPEAETTAKPTTTSTTTTTTSTTTTTTAPPPPPPRTTVPVVTVPPTTAAVTTIRITTTAKTVTTPELPSLDYLPPFPVKPATTTTRPPCYPGSKDPRCGLLEPATLVTTTLPPNITPPTTTLEPPPPPTTTKYVCLPGSSDPRCPPPATPPPTTTPFVCLPGSSDPRCPPPATPPPTTTPFVCLPGSRDPRCPPPPPPPPTTQPPAKTTKAPCYQGSKSPECLDRNPKQDKKPILCLPGSSDPECPDAGGSFDAPVTVQPAPKTPLPPPPPSPKAPQTKEGEWKGDPSTHAFHMFHFQRGDGRRGRTNPAATKTKRSADGLADVNEFAQVRLTRGVRVLPAAAAGVEPVAGDLFDASLIGYQAPLAFTADSPTAGAGQFARTYCLTGFSLAASAGLILVALVALVAAVIYTSIRYLTTRNQLAKLTGHY